MTVRLLIQFSQPELSSHVSHFRLRLPKKLLLSEVLLNLENKYSALIL